VDNAHREQLYILDAWKEISGLVKSLSDEFEGKKPNYQSIIKFRLLELLILLSRQGIEKIKKNDRHNIANYIDRIIDNYYHEQFGLDFIAKKIELNKSHLCRVYKSLKGKSIVTALKQRRLQEARALLSNSAMTISEICYACGFNDLSYFYRAFRAEAGLNPGDYRKKFGQY
jgi:AraC-like DNA-binding protein